MDVLPNFLLMMTHLLVIKLNQENGFWSVTKKKVPILGKTHCWRHLEFTQQHENWTVDDCKTVFWSNKTIINRIESNKMVYVLKRRVKFTSDCPTSVTVKCGEGNNLVVWGVYGLE